MLMPMTRKKPSRRTAGFTLIEMLIVIGLIALILGLGIANYDKIFGRAERDIARQYVESSLAAPLQAYKIHMGSYPNTAQGLRALLTAPENSSGRWGGPYIKGKTVPLDPWKREYQYRYPGSKNSDSYDLFSFGPDGVESEDDIGNW